MSHAMQGAGSIYFATLQGYVINETELYIFCHHVDLSFNKSCAVYMFRTTYDHDLTLEAFLLDLQKLWY